MNGLAILRGTAVFVPTNRSTLLHRALGLALRGWCELSWHVDTYALIVGSLTPD